MPTSQDRSERSAVLPTDPFDIKLSELINRNGTHIPPVCIQHIDDYGNTTLFSVQTVRTDLGATGFLTIVRGEEARKYVLPPKVLAVIDRQREQAITIVRRRHGQRLAESQPPRTGNPFTPEMRKKAAETRKRKAAARRAKKGGRA